MAEKAIARGGTLRVESAAEVEERRVEEIRKRRLYFEGRQYEDENQSARDAYCKNGTVTRLPEHLRLHAYSTQIQDCLEFIASMVAGGLSIRAKDRQVQDVVDEVISRSPQLVTYDEQGSLVPAMVAILEDALVAGDVVAHVLWDWVDDAPYVELWESEKVEFETVDTTRVARVLRRETVWRTSPTGTDYEATEVEEYRLEVNEDGVMECVRIVRWEDEEEPAEGWPKEWLGIGRIPWIPLRVGLHGIRSFRGESIISEQSMETADRFNAVEQQGFLISRYNSHANIAVIGDAATLKIESEGAVHKDVADVLTFPGGTALQVLSLPTDPQMIEHQRDVLSEALHAQFGVTRLEPSSLQGMGGVTGYALEILNQKSRGTTSKMIRQWRKDLIGLIELVLDVTAWKRAAAEVEVTEDLSVDDQPVVGGEVVDVEESSSNWWDVDPEVVFPERSVAITMGTVDFVDDARVRADFQAGMISREEALRQRGHGPESVQKIVGEITAEKDKAREAVMGFGEGTEPGFGESARPGFDEE